MPDVYLYARTIYSESAHEPVIIRNKVEYVLTYGRKPDIF